MKVYSKRRRSRRLIIGCTSSEHSFAAELIANNSDLLTEILIRVPAKSLIRFKSVSKQWLSLISDSQFASDHARRNHHSSVSALYFYSNRWSLDEQPQSVSIAGHQTLLPTLSFLDGVVVSSCTTTIERSCNGLILCSNGFRKPPYIVCNLTTRKFSLLPDIGPTSSASYRKNAGAFLAFDPSKSPHYKVILFSSSYVNNGRWVEIEIYSSQTSSWKHISVPDPRGVPFMFSVFWNGAIHCITYANVHVRFEVEEEKFIQTPMPRNPKIISPDKIRYFGGCGDDLLLIQTPQPCAMGFSVLQMHRDYCGWIVKYRVNLRSILSVFPKTERKTIVTCSEFNVLCVVKGANEKDFTLVLAIRGKVISYNVKSNILKELYDLSTADLDDWRPSWCNTYQFIESLSPGKMTNSKGTLVIGYNSSEHTPATELIGSNVDILTEILTCVPAKFVIRFKCVSKDWFSLISNSPFSRNHSNRYPSALFSGLFINPVTSFDDEKVKSVSLHGQHQSLPTSSLLDGVGYGSGSFRIEDSCKGLLLCLNGPTCFIFGVFLSSMFGGYLAFDPSKSPHYIVVLVSYIRNSDGCFYLIDIYSSESTSWTHMRAAAPPGYPFAKKVFWNGSIHWMSYDNVYIRFDVDAEKLIGTRMPSNPKILSEERIWYFGECCGHLLLVQCCDMGFRILEMERNYCYWIEKYQGANEKDFTLVLSIPGKIVSYNLKCKTVKVLCDYRTVCL
ncbi:unnamed protein product [Camellia sinensis]